jgi:hypothetical protein
MFISPYLHFEANYVKQVNKRKILVLQVYSPRIKNYADISKQSVSEYCKLHGYDYAMHEQKDDYTPSIHWAKIDSMILFLKYDYQWVWVLDSDCLIHNNLLALDKLIDMAENQNSFVSIVCSANGDNGGRLINSGSMIYRTTCLSQFITDSVVYRNLNPDKAKDYFHEQDFINDYFEEHFYMFHVMHMNALNSHWQNFGRWNLVHHYMMQPEKYEKMLKAFNTPKDFDTLP